jgi:RHH-type rel operon transcriptional repressor/antitoxin RelB
MEPMSDTVAVVVHVSRELERRLDLLSQRTQRSRSETAAEAIAIYLDTQEWQVAEIERAVREADQGDAFVEHEEVERWLRSWGTDDELPPPKCG